MEKTHVLKTIKFIKENSPKRNFKQRIDLIINIKDLDLKKPSNKVDVYTQLHFDRGKPAKICGLVGPELQVQAKANFDNVILLDDFSKLDKKKIKKLAHECSFFVAQANIMTQVATTFGKVLGSRGKMPNPKAGAVVPPNANLAALAERLRKTVRIKIDTSPIYQVAVGAEDTPDEQIADNILTIYNTLVHALPNDVQNFKNAYLKTTMGTAYKIGAELKVPDAKAEKPAKAEKKSKEKVE